MEPRIKRTEEISKYQKQYREKHPEKFYSLRKCEDCGIEYKINCKTHHLRSKNHELNVLKNQLKKLKETAN